MWQLPGTIGFVGEDACQDWHSSGEEPRLKPLAGKLSDWEARRGCRGGSEKEQLVDAS